MSKILITGGSGLVGKALSKKLQQKGYEVIWLSTQKNKASDFPTYYWNISEQEIQAEAFTNVDYIIHLAGVSVGDARWTNNQKKEITSSRVDGAELILKKVKEYNVKLKAFISASGINYYGTNTTEIIFSETDNCGTDFLADVCKHWEAAADEFNLIGVRTVKMRTGIVLSTEGGALKKMLIPVKLGIGSPLGSGKQYMPWIHIQDLCNMYIKAIEDDSMRGAYNAISPEHITNKEFLKHLAKVLHKPFFMPAVPAFILKLLFAEMACIVLEGSRASANKIEASGYRFVFADIDSAFKDCVLNQTNTP
jgi:uncharacterized protein (TIGR01777 family)